MKIRQMAAMLVFALSATALYAQTPQEPRDAQFTIKVPTAEVHKAPTTASPVVGQATQGSVLLVTRELGSWVRVPWPPGPDGVAYVHVSMGSLSHGSVADTSYISADVARTSASAFSSQASQSTSSSASANPRPAPHASQQSQYVGLPSHTIGAGAVMTTDHFTFGGSGRLWLSRHIGAQVQLTHQSFTDADNDFKTISFLPSAVVTIGDRVSDYLSLRPYVGGGLSVAHMTMQAPAVESKTVMGVQFFGGAELTFASVPQVGVSFDVGYRHAGESFEGVDASGLAVSGAAHWYFR
jgi:hypothetical protein